MKFSSTQSNLIVSCTWQERNIKLKVLQGTFGNLGMYAGGIPVGILVDSKGPKPGVILGGTLMGSGYFAMHRGIGGASAFSGSIKTSALNWPSHRGTATAFPLSAFGLGAFFFAFISNVAFPDNTSSFLLLLSLGCLGMTYLSVAFLRVVPQGQLYTSIATDEDRRSSNPLRRTKSKDDKLHHHHEERGTLPTDPHDSSPLHHDPRADCESMKTPDKEPDETSSLMSRSTSSSPGDVPYEDDSTEPAVHHSSKHPDIRGLALLKQIEFYQLWLLLGILTGVGLMTIK
ncbi:MAG: hypothetical protein Q9209_007624 [Squamulea sp. 1 TL-2023]